MSNTEFATMLRIEDALNKQNEILSSIESALTKLTVEEKYCYNIRVNGVIVDKDFFTLDEACWYIENNIDNWWKTDVWLAPVSDVMRVELESTEYANYVALDENNNITSDEIKVFRYGRF